MQAPDDSAAIAVKIDELSDLVEALVDKLAELESLAEQVQSEQGHRLLMLQAMREARVVAKH